MIKKEIIFGLGCFWSVQKFFDSIDGVIETEVGYAGGIQPHATYKEIGDHTEVIKIIYDESIISFTDLMKKFMEKRDPTFPLYKTQYDTLVLYNNDDEKAIVEELLYQVEQKTDRAVNVRIEKQNLYFPAEEYHQKYTLKRETGTKYLV